MNKILINGRAGAGKDLAADYLVNKHGYKKLAFADGIYDIAYEFFLMDVKDRKLLQQIGEMLRRIDPDVWVDYTYRRADKYEKVVISDCRRENEYLKGVDKGYQPIRINADEDVRIERIEGRDGAKPDPNLLENDSETGADNLDFTELYNNTSVEELYEQIDKLVK